MVKTAFSIRSSGLSDLGLVRKQNEDAWAAAEELFVLADGMGGHQAGEVAAQMAVSSLIEEAAVFEGGSKEEVVAFCKEAMGRVNQKVYKEGEAHPGWKGMGCTLTALFFSEKLVAVAHVGDSRAYRIREGAIKQLTVDHTVMNRMKGAKEAALFKHVLTRAIGTQSKVRPQVQTFPVHLRDRFLLCSDGLTNYLSDEEILSHVTSFDLDSAAQHLIALANERGGADNTTVVLLEVES